MKKKIFMGLIGMAAWAGAADAASFVRAGASPSTGGSAATARSAMTKPMTSSSARMSTSSFLGANNKLKSTAVTNPGNGGGKTDVDLSGYATESWVTSQGFITDADIGHSDLATKTWVESMGYGSGTSCAGKGAGTYMIEIGAGGAENCVPISKTADTFTE